MKRPLVRVLVVTLLGVAGFVAVLVTDTEPQLGLDLQGGLSVTLAPKGEVDSGKLDKAVDIVRSRVDALGVAEPEISRQGDTIVVDLPGVEEVGRARRLIGTTAELQFRPVLSSVPLQDGRPVEPEPVTTTTEAEAEPTTTTGGAGGGGDEQGAGSVLGRAAQEGGRKDRPPASSTSTTGPEPDDAVEPGQAAPADQPITAEDVEGTELFQLGPAEVTGEAIETARADFDEASGGWTVNVDFTDEGSRQWDEMGARYHRQQVAIVLDGVVQSAPAIQPDQQQFEPFGGTAVISGDFNDSEAKDLALVLRFGALPVELERLSEQRVSPTLGRDQLSAGLVAGAVGFGIVLLYVLLYYRFLGLVIWFTLLVTAFVVYFLVAWLGEAISLTLTLAGVVGLIVSIGIAADSNIVYLERLKEEQRAGRTLRSAADRAFKAAFRTIVAADVVTLLGAALLWLLAIGSVKGFAFFLGLATALDLVIAYFLMHPLVVLVARSRLRDSAWVRMPGSAPTEVQG